LFEDEKKIKKEILHLVQDDMAMITLQTPERFSEIGPAPGSYSIL